MVLAECQVFVRVDGCSWLGRAQDFRCGRARMNYLNKLGRKEVKDHTSGTSRPGHHLPQ
jgi:hypothetical protein